MKPVYDTQAMSASIAKDQTFQIDAADIIVLQGKSALDDTFDVSEDGGVTWRSVSVRESVIFTSGQPVHVRAVDSNMVVEIEQKTLSHFLGDEGERLPIVTATTGPGGVVSFSNGLESRGPVLGPSFVDLLNRANPASSFEYRTVFHGEGFTTKLQIATQLKNGMFVVDEYGQESDSGFVRKIDAKICSRKIAESWEQLGGEDPSIYNATLGENWLNGTSNNPYTTTIGNTLTIAFIGTGFDLRIYRDNRGGVWEVSVDGEVWGTISTWSGTGSYYTHPGPRGFFEGPHVATLRFIGADPVNAPSGGVAPRGWISRMSESASMSRITHGTLRATHVNPLYETVLAIGLPGSNHEAAIRYLPTGSGLEEEFWPRHVANANVMTILAKHLSIDGKAYDINQLSQLWSTAYRVDIAQSFITHHSGNVALKTADGFMRSSVTPSGYEFDLTLDWATPVTVTAGYGVMCPASFVDVAQLNSGEQIDLSAHNDSMITATNPGDSGLLTDPSRPYAAAWDMRNYVISSRLGRPGYTQDWCRVQTRSGGTRPAKFYGWIASAANVPAGERMHFSGRYKIGVKP